MSGKVKRNIRIMLLIILVLLVIASIITLKRLVIKGEVTNVDSNSIRINLEDNSIGKLGLPSSAIIFWKDAGKFKTGDNIIIVFAPNIKTLTSDPPYVSGAISIMHY